MSDRELLELAAKAAGVDVDYLDNERGCELLNSDEDTVYATGVLWNPLADDGDALRLAVKLNLQPRQGVNLVSVLRPDKGGNDENYRDHGGDPYAATRRAIVRAAAEIGRTMKGAGDE
jgi:hypothetical protein